ncbi:hypothetical protein Tco_0842908 [Tanacetum coccineum]|uniref:Uncharacterized protein n=1 Tax=Tanacetum coccineum TaxID=301880 RepID=A0ABQ5B4P4_9ASTR
MADENVPALAPTRSDDQILPFAAWVPIGKSNYVLDLQKKQKNPIFQISTGSYSFLNETRFVFDANLLREALEIMPIDQAYQFVSPPSSDSIMDFVNELGYTEVIHFVSRMAVNNLYQSWRAIFTNVDYDELIWEEFVQAIQTFLTDKANLGIPTKNSRKDEPHVIPYYRFTKLIICEADEVFGMPIPNELISNNIRNAPYYNAYLEIVAKHDQKIAVEKEGKKKPATPSPTKQPKRGKVQKLRKGKPSLQLIDEDEPTQPKPELEPEHQGVAIQEPIAKATRPLPVVEGKGKAIVTEEQAAQSLLAQYTPKRRSTIDQFIFQRWTLATEEASTGPSTQPHDDTSANIIHDSPSPTNAEIGAKSDKTNSEGDTEILQISKELGDDVDKQVFMDEDKAGPDPGESRVALAGLDPEPTHDEFMANMYPNIQESLNFQLTNISS